MQIQRYDGLNAFRFFAAMMVMLAHFAAHLSPVIGVPLEATERLSFVDFFFGLSGFVLTHAYGTKLNTRADFGRFMQKRFARLYPLHFATLMPFILIGLAAQASLISLRDPGSFDISMAPWHLLGIHAWGFGHPALNFPSWSLSAEFMMYLLFPLLLVALRVLHPYVMMAGAVLLALTFLFIWKLWDLGTWEDATSAGAYRALPQFIAGMAIYKLMQAKPHWQVTWGVSYALAIALTALAVAGAPKLLLLPLYPVLVATLAMAERTGAPSPLHRPIFYKLADLSLGILLLHTFSGLLLVRIAKKYDLTSGLAIVTAITIACLFTIAAAFIAERRFAAPARRLLSRPLPPASRFDRFAARIASSYSGVVVLMLVSLSTFLVIFER